MCVHAHCSCAPDENVRLVWSGRSAFRADSLDVLIRLGGQQLDNQEAFGVALVGWMCSLGEQWFGMSTKHAVRRPGFGASAERSSNRARLTTLLRPVQFWCGECGL